MSSLRRKAQIIRLGGFLLIVLLIALCMLSRAFIPVLVGGAIIYIVGVGAMRCPNCGKPVAYNPTLSDPVGWLRGKKTYTWTLDVPRHCSKCGASLE